MFSDYPIITPANKVHPASFLNMCDTALVRKLSHRKSSRLSHFSHTLEHLYAMIMAEWVRNVKRTRMLSPDEMVFGILNNVGLGYGFGMIQDSG